MASHIQVKNLQHLEALQNHEENELAYVEDIKKVYYWTAENGWQPVDIKNKGLELNLYEINKNIIGQLKPIERNELFDKAGMVFDFFANSHPNAHYMLLCREYNYYTIFEFADFATEDFVDAVLGVVADLGEVYAIEEAESALEFWVKPTDCDDPMVFILFPYDAGVVYYV